MPKNTGKPSEELFDAAYARKGKAAWVFKFTDAAEARGMNKKHVNIKSQPSDRLVVENGHMFLAEVKSTIHETRFDFSLLRTTQSSFAKQCIAAGGDYDVFIHSLHHDRWFRVPYRDIVAVKAQGRSSMYFSELTECTLT